VSAAGDRLRRLAERADGPAGRDAANAGAQSLADAMTHKLSMRGHSRGTPTPSAPGTPPARVSGRLAGSVTASPASGGGGVWTAHSGPHGVIYEAIQNYGGVAGRNHTAHLPPRPYTAKDSDRSAASRAATDAFHRAMGV
jgi:phage gpG-like protein